MDQKQIFSKCKELGCCDACGLRYLGIRNPKAYENAKEFALKFQDKPVATDGASSSTEKEAVETNNTTVSNGDSPPNKKHKGNPCVTCLGLLQEEVWPECNKKVKELLDKKRYECTTFACALSAPIVTILRERVVSLKLSDACKDYDAKVLTPLKEAWKWSFGTQLATYVGINLDAGHLSPLLVTLHMEYPDDLQELEVLKTLSPTLFESRSQQRKRFTVEFTRRSVEQALEGVTLEALEALPGRGEGIMAVGGRVECVSVGCTHAPAYVGGRGYENGLDSQFCPLDNPYFFRGGALQTVLGQFRGQGNSLAPYAKGLNVPTAEAQALPIIE
ncbi:hypothetical protein evm_003164 [Chilo suppressalis]|nr:hypothetical protein evm_003164 [Chilo suppressalis]